MYYEFLVMLFLLTNAPTTFMSLRNGLLNTFINSFLIVFIDVVFVYQEMKKITLTIYVLFRVFLGSKSYMQNFSCEFWLKLVALLGHVVSKEVLRVDPQKIERLRTR